MLMLSKRQQVSGYERCVRELIKSKLQRMAWSSCKDGNVGSDSERGGKLDN